MTLIIYGTDSPIFGKHQGKHQEIKTPGGHRYFVRVEESGYKPEDALKFAQPLSGETVLNTVRMNIVRTNPPATGGAALIEDLTKVEGSEFEPTK